MFEGKLLSAKPLGQDQLRAIESRFTALLGGPVRLIEETDPSLLGGVRVEIDGRVYDGSLRLQLQEVLKALQTEEEGK